MDLLETAMTIGSVVNTTKSVVGTVGSAINGAKSLVDMVSGKAPGWNSGEGLVTEKKGTVVQTERLFTTRSRVVGAPGKDGRGETAYIKVLTSDTKRSMQRTGEGHESKPSSLGTSSSGVLNDAVQGNGYSSFLLTDIGCSLDEKLQVVEVFGDAEVSYYFGRQPIMFNFSGLLIDSIDNNWFIEWLEMYTNVMRGTQLARNYELIRIVLPNMTIEGTVNRMSWNQNASRDVDIPFQFTFLAKRITPNKVQVPNKALSNDAIKVDWGVVTKHVTQAGINLKKFETAQQRLKDLQINIKDPQSTSRDIANSLVNLGKSSTSSNGWTSGSDLPTGDQNSFANNARLAARSIDDTGKKLSSSISGVTSLFSGVTSALTGIRASLFSPVYGVLSSLTKLIKGVAGSIKGVLDSFLSPVRDILRDVRNIAHEAIGVVNLVKNSIHDVTNTISSFDNDVKTTLSLLKKTAGVIATAPETIGASMGRLVHAGTMPLTTGFLASKGFKTLPNGVKVSAKLALLNSGPLHTAERGARL